MSDLISFTGLRRWVSVIGRLSRNLVRSEFCDNDKTQAQ